MSEVEGPEKWVPEAIAEQEAYLRRMKEARRVNWVEETVPFEGPYRVFVDDANLIAEVRKGERVHMVFRGEVAWADAIRTAGDLNVAHKMKES